MEMVKKKKKIKKNKNVNIKKINNETYKLKLYI